MCVCAGVLICRMVRRWCSRWWDTRRNRWRQQCSSWQNWQNDRCCFRLAKICCSSCHQGTDLQAAVPQGMRAPGAVPWASLLIAVGSCQVAVRQGMVVWWRYMYHWQVGWPNHLGNCCGLVSHLWQAGSWDAVGQGGLCTVGGRALC